MVRAGLQMLANYIRKPEWKNLTENDECFFIPLEPLIRMRNELCIGFVWNQQTRKSQNTASVIFFLFVEF
jgi:hypothetical protein